MAMTEMLGRSFIQALNDFEKKGSVNIRTGGGPMAHPSIIVDRNDDHIFIESVTTFHMSHKQLVYLDEKLNKAGKYAWLLIKTYVGIINTTGIAKRVHALSPKESAEFLRELFNRMLVIVDEGEYNTENIRETFQAMYNAFDDCLEAMILEVIQDILNKRETKTNICRTCKYCSNMDNTPGYGVCKICTFTPTNSDTITLGQFQSEYGKHVFSDKGIIYTDITTGCETCIDYVRRPINVGGVVTNWLIN
jgi:hypothetical protein